MYVKLAFSVAAHLDSEIIIMDEVLAVGDVSFQEIPDVQAGFRKSRGTGDLTANICWIMEKAREFQKNIFSALLTMPSL